MERYISAPEQRRLNELWAQWDSAVKGVCLFVKYENNLVGVYSVSTQLGASRDETRSALDLAHKLTGKTAIADALPLITQPFLNQVDYEKPGLIVLADKVEFVDGTPPFPRRVLPVCSGNPILEQLAEEVSRPFNELWLKPIQQ